MKGIYQTGKHIHYDLPKWTRAKAKLNKSGSEFVGRFENVVGKETTWVILIPENYLPASPRNTFGTVAMCNPEHFGIRTSVFGHQIPLTSEYFDDIEIITHEKATSTDR